MGHKNIETIKIYDEKTDRQNRQPVLNFNTTHVGYRILIGSGLNMKIMI